MVRDNVHRRAALDHAHVEGGVGNFEDVLHGAVALAFLSHLLLDAVPHFEGFRVTAALCIKARFRSSEMLFPLPTNTASCIAT